MNQDETTLEINEQSNRLRQEQRAAEERQTEERRQAEERSRIERAAQEERRREDDRRREDQQRQDDRRRQDDERRRTEQQTQETQRRQENQKREQMTQSEVQTQGNAIKNLHEKSYDNEQARYAREKGVAYVETSGFVRGIYRNINDLNNAHYNNRSPDGRQIKNEGKGNSSSPNQDSSKEISAIDKFKAHAESLAEKVQARLTSQSQNKTQGRSR